MTNTFYRFEKRLGKRPAVLLGFLFLAIVSDIAYSYIEVSGMVTPPGETWGPNVPGGDDTYLVTSKLSINNNATLTIQAGTTIKFMTGLDLELKDNGTLYANGASGNPVVFTSVYDDEYGDDTDGDNPDGGAPSPGDWNGLYLNGHGGKKGTGQFDYCIIRYGGGGTDGANIHFDESDPDTSYFRNSISEYSAGYGVLVEDCSPEFRDSTIANNDGYGVYITGDSANPDFGTHPEPGNNTFENNGGYHLYNDTDNVIPIYGNEWIPAEDVYGPTMVVLSSFTATTGDGRVTLAWRSKSEINNVGFVVYRGDTKGGNYTRIAFVPGAEDSETSSDYQHTDAQVQSGRTYYYYLEDIDLAGKRTKSDVIKVSPIEEKAKRLRELKFRSFIVPRRAAPESLPKQNSLLSNYPNPFNPETWIPYNLAQAADVTIRIYDIRGHQIRTLHLGYQPAGFYLNKDKAAYWDGRSNTGERAGSGVYFYRLSAGSFSAVRKMVILR